MQRREATAIDVLFQLEQAKSLGSNPWRGKSEVREIRASVAQAELRIACAEPINRLSSARVGSGSISSDQSLQPLFLERLKPVSGCFQ